MVINHVLGWPPKQPSGAGLPHYEVENGPRKVVQPIDFSDSESHTPDHHVGKKISLLFKSVHYHFLCIHFFTILITIFIILFLICINNKVTNLM